MTREKALKRKDVSMRYQMREKPRFSNGIPPEFWL
jgi:hypothetical protein